MDTKNVLKYVLIAIAIFYIMKMFKKNENFSQKKSEEVVCNCNINAPQEKIIENFEFNCRMNHSKCKNKSGGEKARCTSLPEVINDCKEKSKAKTQSNYGSSASVTNKAQAQVKARNYETRAAKTTDNIPCKSQRKCAGAICKIARKSLITRNKRININQIKQFYQNNKDLLPCECKGCDDEMDSIIYNTQRDKNWDNQGTKEDKTDDIGCKDQFGSTTESNDDLKKFLKQFLCSKENKEISTLAANKNTDIKNTQAAIDRAGERTTQAAIAAKQAQAVTQAVTQPGTLASTQVATSSYASAGLCKVNKCLEHLHANKTPWPDNMNKFKTLITSDQAKNFLGVCIDCLDNTNLNALSKELYGNETCNITKCKKLLTDNAVYIESQGWNTSQIISNFQGDCKECKKSEIIKIFINDNQS
jgi:hypothetical protein